MNNKITTFFSAIFYAIFLFCINGKVYVQTYVSGNIPKNTTWNMASSPIFYVLVKMPKE